MDPTNTMINEYHVMSKLNTKEMKNQKMAMIMKLMMIHVEKLKSRSYETLALSRLHDWGLDIKF